MQGVEPDLGWRWPYRVVAAEEDRLNVSPNSDSVCGSHALGVC